MIAVCDKIGINSNQFVNLSACGLLIKVTQEIIYSLHVTINFCFVFSHNILVDRDKRCMIFNKGVKTCLIFKQD